MSLFSSSRERRLWLWVLAVVAAIYSTLGLAGTLVDVLRARDLLDSSFMLGLLLIVATIVMQGLKTRHLGFEFAVALGVAAVYLLVFLRMGIPIAERTHLIEYGVVAVFVYEALSERASNGRRVPLPALLAVAMTGLLGWIDEGIQAILPNRVYDIQDVGFNALAGLMAVAASVALVRARRWRG